MAGSIRVSSFERRRPGRLVTAWLSTSVDTPWSATVKMAMHVRAALTLGVLLGVMANPQAFASALVEDDLAIELLENPRDSVPSADLSPGVVVRLQMMALGQNDIWGENAGIATAFRFASPTNRSVTGPLERFIGLLNNPQYRPMLTYQSIEYAQPRISDDEALVPVLLTMANNERFGYMFVLSRSTEDECNCWMTDRVSQVYVNPDERSREPI